MVKRVIDIAYVDQLIKLINQKKSRSYTIFYIMELKSE